MDEYTSEICMGGHNTVVLHNTCEDSLLAAPIILDLLILAELCERIEVKTGKQVISGWSPISTLKMSTLKMSAPKMSTPKMSTSNMSTLKMSTTKCQPPNVRVSTKVSVYFYSSSEAKFT